MDVRRGRPADADAIADAFIPSFESLTFLPRLHTHEEHRAHIRDTVLGEQEVWVAEQDGGIAGFAALTGDVLTNLYVHPERQGRGAGGALLAKAKERRPEGFTFWVFQQNDPCAAVLRAARLPGRPAHGRQRQRGEGAGRAVRVAAR